jgi:magnesium transporter
MASVPTVFISQLIGKSISFQESSKVGRLKDLVADVSFARPRIVAALVLFEGGLKSVDFSTFYMKGEKGKSFLACREIKPANLRNMETVNIANQLLNKKIVDMNRKKTIPVYDLKIAFLDAGAFIVAVDAGMQGRLRQLGISFFTQRLFRLLGLSISNQLVLWDNVEALNLGKTGVGFSKSMSSLSRLNPSDMADIMEEMDHETRVEIFSAMDTERAADVLEELEPDMQDKLLDSIPSEQIADVLEIMPADEVADILDEADEKKVEELLKEMNSEISVEVRELMEYKDDEVGSLMTTDHISLHGNDTVQTVWEVLRRDKPKFDMVYYLYVVSDKDEIKGMVSLRDIIVSGQDAKLFDIMESDIVCVLDSDKIESLNDIIAKYNLLAVPVVDENKVLLGVVTINDVLFGLLHNRRKRL